MSFGSRIPAISAHARRLQKPAQRLSQSPLTVTASIPVLRLSAPPKGRLAVVTPSHQCPLGVTLSLPRRLELLAWAAKMGAWIVEDDYDSEFRYRGHPLPALKSLDEADRVFYAGSFSKVLSPGLRLGYLVVPSSELNRFSRDTELF